MPSTQETLNALEAAGLDRASAQGAVTLEAIIQRWRRRAVRRLPELRAIKALGLPLDVPQFDVLNAIWDPCGEFGRDPSESAASAAAAASGGLSAGGEEIMVATIAKRLSIDPSRASRLVSDLISAGFARRAVSQSDARRTIVELTDEGAAAVSSVRAYRITLMAHFLKGWSNEDIAAFTPLFERFITWTESAETQADGQTAPEEPRTGAPAK
ncbi:MAG: MarR family winged helix-turn-helix transcriptional regulator [Paracoccaceae bacterium]